MRKRSHIARCILVGIISFFVVYLGLRTKEPSFQGRNLSAWLSDYGNLSAPVSNSDKRRVLKNNADNAVYNMGTNAIPMLMQRLQASDSSFRYRLATSLNRLSFIKNKFTTTADERWHAGLALQALGSKAKPAIPELTRLLTNPSLANHSLNLLMNFDNETAIPILLQMATNNNAELRKTALLDLGYRRQGSNGVIQVVLTGLKDPDPNVRAVAVGMLSRFPSEADLVVPALVDILSDSSLQHLAIQSLGELGEKARPAVPRLMEIASNKWAFNPAAVALSKIDPAAAQRMGVQRTNQFSIYE
ncbi:HEAT repeat domain-containing protein [Pedosphaera parvula]|uniref:PBS lyase HEAT domain protein repeat-containing protein n=1 Tax=Pedosphaera parvula (strain Ellin514) TaxID=320771 RepID=B9XRH3_PEDPL|nr:HEAT repeat domain-containing protein [Pedosphaera parvula]EEF57544.1 PBS lyase HEAT domain protein repeat-containing protein [Pedosphaera parvula Ellin514]